MVICDLSPISMKKKIKNDRRNRFKIIEIVKTTIKIDSSLSNI